jgi:predicted RND superfamily exporter protein
MPGSNEPEPPGVLRLQGYLKGYLQPAEAEARIEAPHSSVERPHIKSANGRSQEMLGTLLVIALLLLLFGVVGGIAISKFLFLILIVAAVVALFGVLSGRSA